MTIEAIIAIMKSQDLSRSEYIKRVWDKLLNPSHSISTAPLILISGVRLS